MNITMKEVLPAIKVLKGFVGTRQLETLGDLCRNSEEGQFFKDKIVEMADIVSNMPESYETDGQGEDAIVHLHYFRGNVDSYITEKDSDPEGAGQHQAFGKQNLGMGCGTGYISIQELINNNLELDLYWTPVKMGEVK